MKQRYQQLVKKTHPDKVQQSYRTDGTPDSDKHVEDFIAIKRSWDILGDPVAKREYDANLKQAIFDENVNIAGTVSLKEFQVHSTDTPEATNMNQYSYDCRCGGEYILTDADLSVSRSSLPEQFIIGCSNCSLYVEILL